MMRSGCWYGRDVVAEASCRVDYWVAGRQAGCEEVLDGADACKAVAITSRELNLASSIAVHMAKHR